MEYNIKSKPTIYKGTKYRSRLEARWAAFFDLINWRYQYEPFDLHGWTPDFQVFGSDGRYILFEVKPYLDNNVLSDYFHKISEAASIDGETEFDVLPSCIVISEIGKISGYGNSMLAGYQITPWGYFEVQWKADQEGINTEFDIGSMLMNFDGLLWNTLETRKQFIINNDAEWFYLMEKWVDAGELSRFHYNG